MDKNFGFMDEHTVPLEVLSYRLQTNLHSGLPSKAALLRLGKDGLNRFTRPKPSTFERLVKRRKPVWSELEWNQVFNSKLADRVTVIRDDKHVVIEGLQVVVGDMVELHEGDKAPGDLRILDSEDLIVNNLLITGEKSVAKSDNCTSINPLLSENLMFACTKVTKGRCLGIILRTGDDTVFGQLNRFATKVMLPKQFTSTADLREISTM